MTELTRRFKVGKAIYDNWGIIPHPFTTLKILVVTDPDELQCLMSYMHHDPDELFTRQPATDDIHSLYWPKYPRQAACGSIINGFYYCYLPVNFHVYEYLFDIIRMSSALMSHASYQCHYDPSTSVVTYSHGVAYLASELIRMFEKNWSNGDVFAIVNRLVRNYDATLNTQLVTQAMTGVDPLTAQQAIYRQRILQNHTAVYADNNQWSSTTYYGS